MKIGRQTLWSFLPIAISAFTALATIPTYLRFLGAQDYAIWLYVTSMAGILGFADMGIAVAAGRFFGEAIGANDTRALKEYWATAHLCQLVVVGLVATLFGVLGAALGPLWFEGAAGKEFLLRWCFALGAGSLFLGFYSLVWNILFQAHLDFALVSIVRAGSSLAAAAAGVISAWMTRDPAWVMFTSFVVSAFGTAALVLYARKRFLIGFEFSHFSWARFHEMKAYTGRILLSMVSSFLGGLERIIAGRVLAAEQFTYYNISLNAGSRVFALGQATMSPIFHNTTRELASKGLTGAASVYEKSIHLFFPIFLHCTGFLFVWNKFILELWLGKSHHEISMVFFPLVFANIIGAFSLISSAQLPAIDRVNTMTLFSVISSLACALGVFVGWKTGGFFGLAWGYMLSRIVNLGQDLWLSRHLNAKGIWTAFGISQVAIHGAIALVVYIISFVILKGQPVLLLFLALFHAAWYPAFFFLQHKNLFRQNSHQAV